MLILFVLASGPAIAKQTTIIHNCFDGDTGTGSSGERVRLYFIDSPDLKRANADPISAKAAKDYLNGLVAGKEVFRRRIRMYKFGKTIAEISRDEMNIQQRLVEKGFARVYKRYENQ